MFGIDNSLNKAVDFTVHCVSDLVT